MRETVEGEVTIGGLADDLAEWPCLFEPACTSIINGSEARIGVWSARLGGEKSMAVRCSHCGEELMGSVNRCWKCGQQFTSRPGPSGMPPVRRSPVAIAATTELPSVSPGSSTGTPPAPTAPGASNSSVPAPAPGTFRAELVAPQQASATDLPAPSGTSTDSGARVQSGAGDTDSPARVRRVGSPFAASNGAGAKPLFYEPPPPPPMYPRNVAAVGGAIGALVLGILSLIGCFFTNAALITGILGLVMGVWGLYSTRRGVAVAGLLVCFLAMSISSFNGAVELYVRMYGEHPFKPKPTLIGVPEDELEVLD